MAVGLAAPSLLLTSQTEAQQAIDTAQSTIYIALHQVSQAELAGADIADLVSTLNAAIIDLNMARAAFNASNYASAILLAEQAQAAAEAVIDEAQDRLTASLSYTTVQFLIWLSVIVAVVIIAYLFITRWRKHKQQRTKTLLRMKIRLPEKEEGDT